MDRFQVIIVKKTIIKRMAYVLLYLLTIFFMFYYFLCFIARMAFIHLRTVSSSVECGIFQYWILIHLS